VHLKADEMASLV